MDVSGLNVITTDREYSRTCRPLHGSTSEGEGVGLAGEIGGGLTDSGCERAAKQSGLQIGQSNSALYQSTISPGVSIYQSI
jgi:hypothetical protein